MAMTFDERHAQLKAMLEDADLALTGKEALELIYRWMMFEYALIRVDRAEKRLKKRATWMKNITEVYNFRKDLARQ